MAQFAVVAALLGFAWFVGVAGLLLVGQRPRVAPGLAPVVGVGIWVVVLATCRLLPGSTWPLVLPTGAMLLGAGLCWYRARLEGDLGALVRASLPAICVSFIVAAVYVLPWLLDGSNSGAVHFTSNHDAFYYGSGAQWLADHSSLDPPSLTALPGVGSDSPAYLPAMQTLSLPLRSGFELTFAAVLAITKLSAFTAWPAIIAVVGGLVGAASMAFAQSIGARWFTSVPAGVLVGLSPLAVFQVANQNGASLLGVAFALAVLTLWLQVVGVRGASPSWRAILLVGVACAALITTYWEAIPAIAIALTLATVVYAWKVGIGKIARRVIGVALATAACGFVGIWIAFRSARALGSLNDVTRHSPFSESPVVSGIAWILGAARYTGPDNVVQPGTGSVVIGLVLLIVMLIGLVLTLFVRGLWPITVGAVLSLLLGWWWWGSILNNGYTHRRFVEFSALIVCTIAIAGWARLPWLRAWTANPAMKRGVVAASTGVLGLSLAVSLLAASGVTQAVNARGYDRDYNAIAARMNSLPGRLLIATPDRLDQAWVGLGVADRPSTEFLVPCSCLIGLTLEPYATGERPEWILMDERTGSVTGDATPTAVDGRLTLYRLGAGAVTVESTSLTGKVERVEYRPVSK